MAKKENRVYWITGLSGAGKSTIGSCLTELLRRKEIPVIFLDGDEIREVLGQLAGHSEAERRHLSMTYSRLCRMISAQGVAVVCSTISMFDDTREWNRENIRDYTEVYIRASLDVLVERDQKQLYSRALRGEAENVMGVNMNFEEPKNADVIIDNDGSCTPEEIAERLMSEIHN